MQQNQNHNNNSLNEAARKFQDGVNIEDRRYRFRTYKECFVGSEAVDFLIMSNLADSRREAVELGNALMIEFGLFEHVTKGHPFQDEYLFYRFTRTTSTTSKGCRRSSMVDGDHNKMSERDLTLPTQSTTQEFLQDLAEDFQREMMVKDRVHRFKTYKDCFVGSEAVDYLVRSNHSETRKDAVELGNMLMTKLNLFENVTKEHSFKDQYIFYRFVETGASSNSNNKFHSSSFVLDGDDSHQKHHRKETNVLMERKEDMDDPFVSMQREMSIKEDLSYNGMNLTTNGTILNKQQIKEKRIRLGFCPTCDRDPVRLFEVERSKINPLASTKKPLTIKGKCVNGRCLVCRPDFFSTATTIDPNNDQRRRSIGPGVPTDMKYVNNNVPRAKTTPRRYTSMQVQSPGTPVVPPRARRMDSLPPVKELSG